MLHNQLITEYPCDGKLVRVEERCTRWLTVLRCSGLCYGDQLRAGFHVGRDRNAGDESGVVGVRELSSADLCALP
jgi:hypothetical protein